MTTSPLVSWILLALSLIADLASVIGLVRGSGSDSTLRRLTLALLLVMLSGLAAYQSVVIRDHTEAKTAAADLLVTWPKIDGLPYVETGELIGVVLSGLQFMEDHRKQFPETYEAAKSLVHNRLNDLHRPESDTEARDERDSLEDTAGAMILLIRSTAGKARR